MYLKYFKCNVRPLYMSLEIVPKISNYTYIGIYVDKA